MSDNIVMRVKQRHSPGFTPRQRQLRALERDDGTDSEPYWRHEWEGQPSGGRMPEYGIRGDQDFRGEPAVPFDEDEKSETERAYRYAPWAHKRGDELWQEYGDPDTPEGERV